MIYDKIFYKINLYKKFNNIFNILFLFHKILKSINSIYGLSLPQHRVIQG